jgi:hypothetical protein
LTDFLSKARKQTATLWRAGDPDQYGWFAFSEPEEILVRWEERIVEFLDANGTNQFSNALVYTAVDLEMGDYLFLGVSVEPDPKTVQDSYAVRKFDSIPSISGRIINRVAYI